MEKRVILASALCIVFLAIYANIMGRMYPATVRRPAAAIQAAAPANAAMNAGQTTFQALDDEEVTIIESDLWRVEIGLESAAIRAVTLKEFRGEADKPLRIASSFPLLRPTAAEPLHWAQTEATAERVSFASGASKEYHISYSLDRSNQLLTIDLRSDKPENEPLSVVSVWPRADQLDDRNNPLEISLLHKKPNGAPAYKKYRAQKVEKNVPRGTFLAALTERYFCQIIQTNSGPMTTTLLPSPHGTISAKLNLADSDSVSMYIGPRDYFHLQRAEMEKAFEIGILGQIGLILLKILSGIAGLTKNFGVAVILFSMGITLLMSPFTLMGMRSMRRMQELRPQIDRIMAQHKDDPTRANREVFALYKENKISPLSGCLPMFLQMPIFIAMFQAMSHYIELRGASFLWIKDLSLPDRAAILPFTLPMLGNEVNVLPIVMAAAMYFQTKLSSGAASASAQQDPTAKMLSGPFMSILFGVMFYHFPSGLVLYWLTNNLVSIGLYRLAK